MNTSSRQSSLPLEGIRVLAFTHAVMGPAAALILADLGAEVINIEPPGGDATRRLRGFGIGYFPYFNRNKRALAVDLKSSAGREILHKLVVTADVVLENFGPGTMERLGYGYEQLSALNPRLIYCSLKGFMPGPYENRVAMDEVVQMMGGLAYMTGPTGQPLRAGTSIVDITGGMFGAMGVLLALYDRQRTGKGTFVKSALFETVAFVMGQHMAYAALTEGPVPPMPERVSAWSIYRLFETRDGEQVFIGIISEKQWQQFCRAFDRQDWLQDERLQSNNDRIREREWFLPAVEAMVRQYTKQEILDRCDRAGICFAPIARPEDLFEDPQLNQGQGALLETVFPNGIRTKMPRLPLQVGDYEFGKRSDPPAVIGADTREILLELGYDAAQIDAWRQAGVVATGS
ncbi:MAG: CoA transferase [Desulfomicrobiaceae bacterium]|nr:CoA transferase [Desulfomicrobiaceae bacterium]